MGERIEGEGKRDRIAEIAVSVLNLNRKDQTGKLQACRSSRVQIDVPRQLFLGFFGDAIHAGRADPGPGLFDDGVDEFHPAFRMKSLKIYLPGFSRRKPGRGEGAPDHRRPYCFFFSHALKPKPSSGIRNLGEYPGAPTVKTPGRIVTDFQKIRKEFPQGSSDSRPKRLTRLIKAKLWIFVGRSDLGPRIPEIPYGPGKGEFERLGDQGSAHRIDASAREGKR